MMLSLDIGCGYRSMDTKRGQIGIDRIKGICTVQADAHYLPFKDECFNKVYLMAILEHLENPKKCIQEVRRVACPKALIFIEIPQITNMAKWRLRKATTEFPIGLLAAYRSTKYQRNRLHKELGHKTHISTSWIHQNFHVIRTSKRGRHTWFTSKFGKILHSIGLKDHTNLDTIQFIAKILERVRALGRNFSCFDIRAFFYT